MRYALAGYYGQGSLGDELILHAMKQLLGEPELVVTVGAKSQGKASLKHINELDALVIGGGTLLGHSIVYPLNDRGWVEAVRVPIFVCGTGVGSLLPWGAPVAQLVPWSRGNFTLLEKAEMVGVRGFWSARICEENRFTRSWVIGDPVLALERESLGEDYWIVNFRHPRWFSWIENQDYTAVARELIACMSKEERVVAIGFDHDDCRYMRDLGLEPALPGVEQLIDLVAKSRGVVGMRLHLNVLAAALGKPFLHLGYSLKAWDFQTTCGMREFLVMMVPQPPAREDLLSAWESIRAGLGRENQLTDAKDGVQLCRHKLAQASEEVRRAIDERAQEHLIGSH